MKSAIIIQARMGSSRFPNKTLLPIGEHSMLGWVILAAKSCRRHDMVIVATTTNPQDRVVCEHAKEYGAETFCGDEDNVLNRYITCAREFGVEVINRVSGDSPLWSQYVADFTFEQHLSLGMDYTASNVKLTFPMQSPSELFSLASLEQAAELADRQTDIEHVTPALRRHTDRFSIASIVAPPQLHRPHYRITVDTPADLQVVQAVFDNVAHERDLPPDLLDVCRFLDDHPEIVAVNQELEQKYNTDTDVQTKVPVIEMPLAYRDQYIST